jgi:uncharacterized membrane protein YeaQ/YmgE (transglycosylase-associated protein family)
MGFLWIIIIGFVAGIIARFLSPGPNDPKGFILTTVLGIAGAFLATFIGQMVGWYRADQGAGFIAATIGALLVLFIWNRLVVSGTNKDISTNDLARSIGLDDIDTMANRFGVSRDDLLSRLQQQLPDVVDQLTPDGRLPTPEESSRWV